MTLYVFLFEKMHHKNVSFKILLYFDFLQIFCGLKMKPKV